MCKPCQFNGCVWPIWSHGFCKYHQGLRKDDKYKNRKSISATHIEKMKELNKGKVVEVKEKSELDKWFDMVGEVIKKNPHCWNCGEFIPEKYYRHASAHIFAKSIFPSIATHPNNFLILSANCGCHHDFDSSLENAQAMQIWDKAVERFKTFEHLITEKHKYLSSFKELVYGKEVAN